MIKKQIWRPDTCGCEIEQTFDYSTDPAILVGSSVLKACNSHPEKNHEVVKQENMNKNRLVKELMDSNPTLKVKDIAFSFDENRNIKLTTKNDI